MSLKSEIAGLFDSFADLLEFKGENPFKIKAFRNGSSAISNIEGDLEPLIKSGAVKDIKGIGKGLQSIIQEYYENGYSVEYESLLNEIPEGITELLKIRGLGVKKIKLLVDELGVNSLDELAKACKENKVASIKGFGNKTEESILKEIERINASKDFSLLSASEIEANRILSILNDIEGIKKIEITGELRRSCEIISKIEYVILVDSEVSFLPNLKNKVVVKDSFSKKIISKNSNEKTFELVYKGCEIEPSLSIKVFIYYTNAPEDFIRLLYITTGSKEFTEAYDLSELEHAPVKDEAGIFNEFNMKYVIPEMREKEYLTAAPGLKANSDLDFELFQGLLHFHTNASDGKNSLTDMVSAAKEFGFKYAAVCDHSKSAYYANGLNEERILLQKKEIAGITFENGLRILQGVESDILKDGELDFTDEFLKEIDFVVASIHSRFNMTEDEMTSRIIKAVENPYTDLLGHPTGRLLLARAPYKVNIRKVIEACARNEVAIEINANPHRLDLDWRNIYYAREKGCLFSINPDAHDIYGITDIKYGIKVARKAGLKSAEVINCFDYESFIKFLNRKVKRNI
jgi:DNA polymerase (family 10)